MAILVYNNNCNATKQQSSGWAELCKHNVNNTIPALKNELLESTGTFLVMHLQCISHGEMFRRQKAQKMYLHRFKFPRSAVEK